MSAFVRYLMVANPGLSNDDLWAIVTDPANGQATTGFTGVAAPWGSVPCPQLDLCLAAALRGQRAPWHGRHPVGR